ncbi:MAG: glycosyltransferase family 9 protein, partial [Deltaproteobacteria bacterium]
MNLSGKRILIVKPSSLGDIVHTLPLVHAVKRCHPSCYVGWIVQRAFQGILEHDPAIDEIIPISIPSTSEPQAGRSAYLRALTATARTLVRLRKRFRTRPYDYVLDLHASFRSGLLGSTNRGGAKIGFRDAKELNPLFQNHRLATDPGKPHAVDRNLAFARFLQCPPIPEDFRIVSGSAQRDAVRRFLEQAGVTDTDRIVYANPAARWQTKLWTVERWAKLADLLIARSNAKVIFGGGAQDVAHIELIAGMMNAPPIVAAGKLSLAESVALIEAAHVYVGVDSGPMHIAAFAGTPVVALFGPTEPALVGPYGEGHRVIRHDDLDCLACRKRSCENRRC